MAYAQNTLQLVQTYTNAMIPFIQNSFCGVSTANHQYDALKNIPNQLGATANIVKPPRAVSAEGLVPVFQGVTQRLQPITLNAPSNYSYAFTMGQILFNVDEYPSQWLMMFGEAGAMQLGTTLEQNVLSNFETHTFRYFGDGVSHLASLNELNSFIANFRSFGVASSLDIYLDMVDVPQIVSTALGQFVTSRNEGMAADWQVGEQNNAKFYQSNLLPTHYSGTTGEQQQALTIVATNDSTGVNITEITVAGATPNDQNAVKAYDVFTVGGANFKTWTGYVPCAAPVQFRAQQDAAADGSGNVTINIWPPMSILPQVDERVTITTNLVASMPVTGAKSHRCAAIVSGKSLFFGNPALPDAAPYETAIAKDPDSGVTIRSYYGHIYQLGNQGFTHDTLGGSTLFDEYAARILVPLT